MRLKKGKMRRKRGKMRKKRENHSDPIYSNPIKNLPRFQKFNGKMFGIFRQTRGQVVALLFGHLSAVSVVTLQIPFPISPFSVLAYSFWGPSLETLPSPLFTTTPCACCPPLPFSNPASFLCICPRCAFRCPRTSLPTLCVNFVTSFPGSLVLSSLATPSLSCMDFVNHFCFASAFMLAFTLPCTCPMLLFVCS